jgi:hypothetical protein
LAAVDGNRISRIESMDLAGRVTVVGPARIRLR